MANSLAIYAAFMVFLAPVMGIAAATIGFTAYVV